jgi:4-diphosphocytidyl-2-C-methyl-D-erythritol kinase
VRLHAAAPAKVNLFLHVGPPDAGGLHPLAGLSAFADVGDRLTLDDEAPERLRVVGPMAEGVPTGPENLVLRALDAFARYTGRDVSRIGLTLTKRLPPASGLGGGSSDAGAALRLARAALAPDLSDADLLRIAATLGADGAMCLFPRVAWTEGHGEILTPEPRLPALAAVLVNPGVPTPTGAVFQAYDRGPLRTADRPAPPADWSVAAVLEWLAGARNDLEPAATALVPQIGQARAALEATAGVRLVRMSGSGATVFGLYEEPETARAAAETIARARPQWWAVATTLHGQDEGVADTPGPGPVAVG